MSDDEMDFGASGDMGDMGGMGGMGGGMDDDFSDDDYGSPGGYGGPPVDSTPLEHDASKLPEGMKKEVLEAAPEKLPSTGAANTRYPERGDEVTVHYTGTLDSDGSKFDSSKDRDQPFNFKIGTGQVIKGWDLGVATMLRGEKAKFTIPAEFGYGEAGAGEKIPPNSTLCFEVELISFKSKNDLFGDDGVITAELAKGEGYKKPRWGDECVIDYKISLEDKVLDQKEDIEYTIGSESCAKGLIQQKVIDKVLPDMKKGMSMSLQVAPTYAFGKEGNSAIGLPADTVCTCELMLKEIYETSDVSFNRDNSISKKTIRQGEGYEKPSQEGTTCTVKFTAVTEGGEKALLKSEAEITFAVGNGEVCDALEATAASMKKGEKAVVTVSKVDLCQKGTMPALADTPKTSPVVYHAEMVSFEKGKETWDMSEQEKLDFGNARKAKGGELFKAGRLQLAKDRYKKVAEMFEYLDSWKDEETKKQAQDLKVLCDLNLAAVALKVDDFGEAKVRCNKVLEKERTNVKALFRLAQAEIGVKEYNSAMAQCKKVLEIEAGNKDVRALYQKAHALQKEEDKKQKGMFGNMMKGLGKLGGDKRTEAAKENMSKNKYDDYGDDDDFDDEPHEHGDGCCGHDHGHGDQKPPSIEDVVYEDPPDKLVKNDKKMKKVVKEGGKRGVEIEGAADMGGLQFFCTTVDEPAGDVDWLYETVRAMNAKSEPTEEERKGGSGNIGKMVISIDDAKCCSMVAYVPPDKTGQITAETWLKDVLKEMKAPEDAFISGNNHLAKATIMQDKEKDLFPLKLKDEGIRQSIDYLKKKGLFPDKDDDDDDEMVFGDDDFPSADDES